MAVSTDYDTRIYSGVAEGNPVMEQILDGEYIAGVWGGMNYYWNGSSYHKFSHDSQYFIRGYKKAWVHGNCNYQYDGSYYDSGSASCKTCTENCVMCSTATTCSICSANLTVSNYGKCCDINDTQCMN